MSYTFNASKMSAAPAAAAASDWHTVERRGGLPMPAAFGGGQRERDNARRDEEARHREAEAETARQARVYNFESKDEYPTLGGAGGSAQAKKVVGAAMNFRDMARAPPARRRELEASTRAYSAAAAAPLTFSRPAPREAAGYEEDVGYDEDV
jgi:hypothetical protein